MEDPDQNDVMCDIAYSKPHDSLLLVYLKAADKGLGIFFQRCTIDSLDCDEAINILEGLPEFQRNATQPLFVLDETMPEIIRVMFGSGAKSDPNQGTDISLLISQDFGGSWPPELHSLTRGNPGDDYRYPAVIYWKDRVAFLFTHKAGDLMFATCQIPDLDTGAFDPIIIDTETFGAGSIALGPSQSFMVIYHTRPNEEAMPYLTYYDPQQNAWITPINAADKAFPGSRARTVIPSISYDGHNTWMAGFEFQNGGEPFQSVLTSCALL